MDESGGTDYTDFPLGRYTTVPEPGWPDREFRVVACPACGQPGRVLKLTHGGVWYHRLQCPDPPRTAYCVENRLLDELRSYEVEKNGTPRVVGELRKLP